MILYDNLWRYRMHYVNLVSARDYAICLVHEIDSYKDIPRRRQRFVCGYKGTLYHNLFRRVYINSSSCAQYLVLL